MVSFAQCRLKAWRFQMPKTKKGKEQQKTSKHRLDELEYTECFNEMKSRWLSKTPSQSLIASPR